MIEEIDSIGTKSMDRPVLINPSFSVFKWNISLIKVVIIIAIKEPGITLFILGHRIKIAKHRIPSK